MLHTSYIEIDGQSLADNLSFLQEKAGSGVRYAMVIKANAYGHGIEQIVPVVEKLGVDQFAVFSIAEAKRVVEIKRDDCDLMILGFIDDDQLAWAIENDISFYVFTSERMGSVIETAKKCNRPARIHVELETGMHRTGFIETDLPDLMALLKEHRENLSLEGLCTHLAGAESIVNHRRIKAQIAKFRHLCRTFSQHGIHPKYRHVGCSAGMLNYPEATFDMVRIGISNYGFWPNKETRMRHLIEMDIEEDPLKRILSWKSQVLSINPVDKGEFISYGKKYKTDRPTKIATIPVGYGYGFSRKLSNNGYVLIGGKRVPVIGTVNMNMMVVDVTEVPDVKVHDEVVLIGNQGDQTISVSSFSDMNNSMNYELLTRLPNHIPREVINQSSVDKG